MQPYFFPYIGYWQLINSVDIFVLFDDSQYKRHGWINRNRILKPDGNWQYILIPLQKHSLREPIKHVYIAPNCGWEKTIIAQLSHYKKKAHYFDEINPMIIETISSINEVSIAKIKCAVI